MSPAVKRLLYAALLFAVVLGLEFGFDHVVTDAAWRQLALFAMVNVVVALSLNVINGLAGQFSIGHAGFVGIGAYAAAVVAGHIDLRLGPDDLPGVVRFCEKLGMHDPATLHKASDLVKSFAVMPPALFAAAFLASAFGLVVGLPSLRLKGDYLAIVTLGFAEIFRLIIATAQAGGESQGPVSAAIASLGGQNGYAGPQGSGVAQYAGPFWIFGTVVMAAILAWRIKFSGWGRALRALREDEIAAAAVGVDPTSYKVTSFVIAAGGGGVAGALLAAMRDGNPTIQPDQFTFTYSFDAITMVILGGSGSVTGAILGGVFVTFTVKMIEQLQGLEAVQALKAAHPNLDLNALRMVLYAAVLIALMILRPEGLMGERELFKRTRKLGPIGKAPAEPVPVTTNAEAKAEGEARPS